MGRSSSPIDFHHTNDTMTRSTSPLHFLNPAAVAHLTHCHHHHHSQQRASSAAADISRLLDPSYLPSSSSRAAHGSPTTVTAYVDPHGDMHDPDYRHFPVSQHHHTNLHLNHSPNKRRGTSPRRPHFDWEIEIDEQALEEEYYEEEGSFAKHSAGPHYSHHNHQFTAPRYPATASSSRTWSSGQSSSATRPRDSSFSTTMSKCSPTYSPTYYSPTGTASTLPTSYEDDAELSVEGSPFEEKEKPEKEKTKKLRRMSKGEKEKEKLRAAEKEKEREREREREEEAKREKEAEEQREREREEREREERRASFEYNNYIDLTPSPRRTSRTYGRSRHRRSLDLYAAEDEERRSEYPDDEDEDDSARLHQGIGSLHPPSLKMGGAGNGNEYVPTCTQSLRRQWQALSLSFRFSLFRAQRRVMRRVASLTT